MDIPARTLWLLCVVRCSVAQKILCIVLFVLTCMMRLVAAFWSLCLTLSMRSRSFEFPYIFAINFLDQFRLVVSLQNMQYNTKFSRLCSEVAKMQTSCLRCSAAVYLLKKYCVCVTATPVTCSRNVFLSWFSIVFSLPLKHLRCFTCTTFAGLCKWHMSHRHRPVVKSSRYHTVYFLVMSRRNILSYGVGVPSIRELYIR